MLTELKSKLAEGLRQLLQTSRLSTGLDSRHPERYSEDGTVRKIRFFESSNGRIAKGTFDEGTHDEKDSRQVKRRKMFVFLFNHISHDPVYGRLPRDARRYWARTKIKSLGEAHDRFSKSSLSVGDGR